MATLNRTFSVKNGIDVANTVVLDSSRNLSNIVTANANTVNASVFITTGGLNLADQANTARDTGNNAYAQANAAYLQANTARGVANDAYAQANTARDTANDSYAQANTARTTANDAYAQANTARGTANDAYAQANAGYAQANTARGTANDAYAQANAGYAQANAAYLQANNAYAEANLKLNLTGGTITGSLNVANITESNIFVSTSQNVVPPNFANTDGERLRLYDFDMAGRPNYAIGVEGGHIWMGVDSKANGEGFKWYGNTEQVMRLSANGVLEVANVVIADKFITEGGLNVTDQANAAYGQANTARNTANDAYQQANTARDAANSAANTVRVSANSGSTLSSKQLNFANSTSIQVSVSDSGDGNANIVFTTTGAAVADAYAQANAAYSQANTAYGQANDAYAQANTARGTANDAYAQANTARTTANDAYAQANTARDTGNNAYAQANAGYSQANAAYGQANAAYGQANAAYGQANAAYAEANLKLNLTGGTISGDLTIDGNLYLSQNTTLINVSTYQVEDPLIYLASNNDISDTVDIGFMGGKNNSGVYAHTGLVRHAADQKYYLFDGLADEAHTNNVINVAATYLATLRANIEANSILLVGNSVATQANLTIANDQANAAYGQANTARGTANDAYAQANTARGTANDAYAQANTARTTANDAYAQANTGYAQANAAYGQANAAYAQANTGYAQANAAYAQANAAYADANTRVLKSGDTMTGGLIINTSGIGLKVANANVTYSLQVGSLNVTTNTVTTSSSGQCVLDVFPDAQLASAKYFVQAKSGSDYHTTEIVLVQDATNVWITEYGSIQTGPSLGTFSADISSGDVRLLFNATNNVNTIRTVRYGIIP